MRFQMSNYLKAFPREEKKTTQVTVDHGNVIEEANQEPKKVIQEPDPDPIPEPDPIIEPVPQPSPEA